MKRKITVLLALLLVLCLSLAGCGSKDESPTSAEVDHSDGQSWHGLYTQFVGDSEPTEGDFELVLYDDGTGVHYRDDLEIDVVWEREGSNITMQEDIYGMTIDYVGTISEDELHLFNGDPEDEWTCEYVYTLVES